jgi:hypothetical protein
MTKKIGTLGEIGAQVGDVVEGTSEGCGTKYVKTISSIGPYRAEYECGGYDVLESEGFRIIRRASSGPVREVTRKEIVPGVYGRVKVFREESGEILLCFVARDGSEVSTSAHWMNCTELTAAIDTLTQIRDAMQEGWE